MKKKNIILFLGLSLMLGSCGLFKEHCHCPKFGQKNVKQPVMAATKSHTTVQ